MKMVTRMRIRFIINPSSGREKSRETMIAVSKFLLEDGHEISARYTSKKDDACFFAIDAVKDEVDRIVVIGGDGTVNEVVAGIVSQDSKIPLTIIPCGTTNDFAKYMKLCKSNYETYESIVGDNFKDIDVGICNNKYFINVGAVGILTDVAHNTPKSLKSVFGRSAYVLKALSEINPENLKPMNMTIESEEFSEELMAYLFLISNTQSIGGFDKMAPLASVSDGKLDCIIVKEMPIVDLISCFMKIRDGKHINHDGVVYFQSSDVKLYCDQEVELDVDGEYFGDLPAHFSVCKEALRITL